MIHEPFWVLPLPLTSVLASDLQLGPVAALRAPTAYKYVSWVKAADKFPPRGTQEVYSMKEVKHKQNLEEYDTVWQYYK